MADIVYLSTRSLSSSQQLWSQWSHPGDILSVLLIIGGDVVQRALAQLSGDRIVPVPFSFGWVAYSFNFMFSVGDKKLMPEPDYPGILINANSGYVRSNNSWVLGRVLRDFEYWKPKAISEKVDQLLIDGWNEDKEKALRKNKEEPPPRERAGLCISVFYTSLTRPSGEAAYDWVFYSGIFTAIVQLGIAAVPCALYNQWLILFLTACGSILAFLSGALPQWKAEKWRCRRGKKTVVLTRGNGSQHAIVIINAGDDAMDLEDLAGSEGAKSSLPQRLWAAFLAFLWLAFLITVSGVKMETWYLLGVGGIGMLQNVFVAGAPRKPKAFGLHLELEDVIGNHKVMKALMALEDKYPRVGASLVSTFFPGNLRDDEIAFWERAKELAESQKT